MEHITGKQLGSMEASAMLRVPEDKKEAMTAAIERLLGYVEILDTLDTEDVAPAVHLFDEKNVLREDETENFNGAILSNAPEQRQGYFVVPGTIADRE